MTTSKKRPTAREVIAKRAHVSWAAYTRYLLERIDVNPDGSRTISKDYVDALLELAATPYELLSTAQKDLDRLEADRLIEELLANCLKLPY